MSTNDLHGRRAVITGGGRGFGRAVAIAYARAGASVLITARNAAELEETREHIAFEMPHARVETATGDVSREGDVRRIAETARTSLGGVDILVCNAGVYGPKGPIETIDFEEWTQAIAINLMGVVSCARAFSASLKASERGKVIILSGGGATKPMPFLSAYAASKAAVVRFAETLAQEWHDAKVDVNTIAPGALNTRLLDEILEAGPGAVGAAFYNASIAQKESGGSPPERGADLCVFLGSRASDGITGKLVSAIWDPWERFGDLRETIMANDVYTLRRIVPEERGMTL